LLTVLSFDVDLVIRRPIAVLPALLAAMLLWPIPVAAQTDAAISEATLREPWVSQLAVLESVTPLVTTADADKRAELGNALAGLGAALSAYEQKVDTTIDRIIGDPQFPYVADQWSQELAARVAAVRMQFDALYGALGVRERADVRAAQASLDALHETLERKSPFERDVIRAIGSFSRPQIVELATRWWNGEERAIAVKKKVAALRQALGEA
jgi:hypothetical protein